MAKSPPAVAPPLSPVEGVGRQVLKLTAGLLVLSAIGYFILRGGNFERTAPSPSRFLEFKSAPESNIDQCGMPTLDSRPLVIEMVYSEDKREWIELAADRFAKLCPNIQVKITAMQDFAAVHAFLAGELHPTIWAPADEMSLRYLDYRQSRSGSQPSAKDSEKSYLAESPLVLLMWQDRLRVLSTILRKEPSDEGQWVRGLCPLIPRNPILAGVPLEAMVPGNWADWYSPLLPPLPQKTRGLVGSVPLATERVQPSLDELKEWGQVKISHARPTHYAAGLGVLYLMANDYLLPPTAAPVAALDADDEPADAAAARQSSPESQTASFEKAFAENKANLRKWLRRCEAGIETELISEQALAEAMFNGGPADMDGVVTYEHMVLPFLGKIESHEESLLAMRVVYPRPTLLARHPAIIFNTVGSEQRNAARRWIAFLRDKEMQYKAIDCGLRPVNPDVSIREYDSEKNRFLRLRRYGILPQLHLTEPPGPSGRMVHELISLWGSATGRN